MANISLELRQQFILAQKAIQKAVEEVNKVQNTYAKSGGWYESGFGVTRGDIGHLHSQLEEARRTADNLLKIIQKSR